MEEISQKYNLKIYIDNVFCDPTEDVSCPRSIIISYRSEVITLMNHNLIGAAQLEVWSYESFILNYYYYSEKLTRPTLSRLLLLV